MKKNNLVRERAEKYKIPLPPSAKGESSIYSPSNKKVKGEFEEIHYMSEEEFLEKAPENQIWELNYGELIVHSPIGYVHKDLDKFLFMTIQYYVNTRELGKVYNSPAAIKLDKDLIYEPDVFFVKKGNKGKIEKYLFVGVPDLVVEVVSPGHELYDKRTKFVNYEKYGVKEYWILDPQKKKYNFYQNIRDKFKEKLPKERIIKSNEIKDFY